MPKVEELKLDIEELNALMHQANRQRSKDILSVAVRKLQTELSELSEPVCEPGNSTNPSANSSTKCYEVKLNNYGWDQSDKFVKIYVTLKNVQTLPEAAVNCNFTEKSMDLKVLGLENRNYHLPINCLCEEIDTTKSYIKIKTDMIVIFLAKKIPNNNWSDVTGVEKRIKEAKSALPDVVKSLDPQKNIMNFMQQMYMTGDDEMKKMIAKAWTESQTATKRP